MIAIIGLLAGIAVPTALQLRREFTRGASLATVRLLDVACRQYAEEMGPYPPSAPRVVGGQQYYGRHWLVQCLVGYMPDIGDDSTPSGATQNGMYDDGKDGYGFRMVRRGPVHGPYNGTEGTQTTQEEVDGDEVPAFVDAFGDIVFYYRYDGAYDAGDNPGGPGDINAYARDTNGRYFRTDFILCTPGPDTEWKAYSDEEETDDVTNFLEE